MSATPSSVGSARRMHRLVDEAGAYLQLTKPRVVALVVFTAVAGMLLAPDEARSPDLVAISALGIALAAAAAAAFNHWLERGTDARMARTRRRPLPTHRLSSRQAFVFAATLAACSCAILAFGVNRLTAILTLATLVGYSVVYTVVLKPRTPQNIVLGGAAGAAPPVLGWTAMTGVVSVDALLLFLIIFLWTPPHFWSLALYRASDYATAGFPMLPVTHGSRFTRASILGYTIVLAVATLLPVASGLAGLVYLAGVTALNIAFVRCAWQLYCDYSDALARRTFAFSVRYLAGLFALLLLDRHGTTLVSAITSLLLAPPH